MDRNMRIKRAIITAVPLLTLAALVAPMMGLRARAAGSSTTRPAPAVAAPAKAQATSLAKTPTTGQKLERRQGPILNREPLAPVVET